MSRTARIPRNQAPAGVSCPSARSNAIDQKSAIKPQSRVSRLAEAYRNLIGCLLRTRRPRQDAVAPGGTTPPHFHFKSRTSASGCSFPAQFDQASVTNNLRAAVRELGDFVGGECQLVAHTPRGEFNASAGQFHLNLIAIDGQTASIGARFGVRDVPGQNVDYNVLNVNRWRRDRDNPYATEIRFRHWEEAWAFVFDLANQLNLRIGGIRYGL